MDENLLLVAFIVFAVLIILIALFLRARTVDDVISDNGFSSISDMPFDDNLQKGLPAVQKKGDLSTPTAIGTGKNKPAFKLNRKNLNSIGKVLTAIGAVMIFAPLPDGLDSIGFGAAFIGYMLTRFTNQPKETAQKRAGTSSTVDTLRKLASKPEYREAMQMLSADMANKNLVTDTDRRKRTLRYLQSKGVPEQEAQRNVTIMAGYLISQQKRQSGKVSP